MNEFFHYLQAEMEPPGLFSWIHLIVIVLVTLVTILISTFFKDAKEKTYKRILFIFWMITIILSVIRQTMRAFHYGPPSYWQYSIKEIPFALCSMIYYFTPMIIFINSKKHPKIVDMANGYICLISLLAGVVVCLYSNMAASKQVFINYQTFIHHGIQVVIGVYVYVYNRRNITIKTLYRTLIAFLVTVAIAIVINVACYPNYVNLFFINPMFITDLPVGNIIQEKAGYPVYLLCYIVAISLATYITYLSLTGIYKLVLKKKEKSNKKANEIS